MSVPEQVPQVASTEPKVIDERLLWLLRVATDEWGALGVLSALAEQYPDALAALNARGGVA